MQMSGGKAVKALTLWKPVPKQGHPQNMYFSHFIENLALCHDCYSLANAGFIFNILCLTHIIPQHFSLFALKYV